MPRKKRHPHPAYEAMLAKMAETGLPEAFSTDVTEHDCAALRRAGAEQAFGWILYASGSHLIWAGHHGKHSSFGQIVSCMFEVAQDCTSRARCAGELAPFFAFVWDGVSFKQVRSAEEMIERLSSPVCGHSACRQNWIDTGSGECVCMLELVDEDGGTDTTTLGAFEADNAHRARLPVQLERFVR